MFVPRTIRAAVTLGLLTTVAMLGATAVSAASEEEPKGGWVTLSASGSGEDEVPAGTGEEGTNCSGTFSFSEAKGELTYQVTVSGNSLDLTAGHLHRGGDGENGDVVIELDPAAINDGTQGQVEVDPGVVSRFLADPENYYLNVHSESFAPPSGVCRAQLTGDAEKPDVINTGTGGQAAEEGLGTGAAAGGGLLALAVAGAALCRRFITDES